MCSFTGIIVPHTSNLSQSIISLGVLGDYGWMEICTVTKNKNTSSIWALAAVREFRPDINYKAVGKVWQINLKVERVKQCLCCSLTPEHHCTGCTRLCRILLTYTESRRRALNEINTRLCNQSIYFVDCGLSVIKMLKVSLFNSYFPIFSCSVQLPFPDL